MFASPKLAQGCQVASGEPFRSTLGITERGLVFGAGSTLVRMAKRPSGQLFLPLEAERARLLAMLSVAFGRSVTAGEVFPQLEAACNYWNKGEKALANFRLAYSHLPRLRDGIASDRLRLAEYILDNGMSSDRLLEELGLPAISASLEKYIEDEPRVPAGYGIESGRWTDSNTVFQPYSTQKPIMLADDDSREEDEKRYEARRLTGRSTPSEDLEHGHGGPLRIPPNIGPGPFARVPIPAGPGARPTPSQSLENDARGKVYGCHTCGTLDPGTSNGRFNCDHQPPTALAEPGEQQYYYPQCARCSNLQGWLVRCFKEKGQ